MDMIGWGAGVEYGSADHLIVFISGFSRGDMQTFHFLDYAKTFPQTKLFLRETANSQYENGIPGVTQNEQENVEFLRFFINRIGASRVTFVSGSVGTHPSILWGHQLGVTDIHLIGPVTDMALGLSSLRGAHPAFKALADVAQRRIAEKYPHTNLRPFLRQHEGAVDCIDIYYSREDPIDSAQAAVIQDLPNVRTTLYHQGDHFRVPQFVQRRDRDMTNRIMAPKVDKPAELRKLGMTALQDLGYAEVRLM